MLNICCWRWMYKCYFPRRLLPSIITVTSTPIMGKYNTSVLRYQKPILAQTRLLLMFNYIVNKLSNAQQIIYIKTELTMIHFYHHNYNDILEQIWILIMSLCPNIRTIGGVCKVCKKRRNTFLCLFLHCILPVNILM